MFNVMRAVGTISFAALCVVLAPAPSRAQVEKGDVELRVAAANSSIGLGDRSGNLSIGVSTAVGYFATRNHEVGGSLGASAYRRGEQKFGDTVFPADTDFYLSLGAFYRYNFAAAEKKGFPFIGAEVQSGDLTSSSRDESLFVRPEVGYKYFVKRNVAVEGSVGWDANVIHAEGSSIGTRVGLVFVF